MARAIKFLVAGLLVCFISSICVQGNSKKPSTMRYKVESSSIYTLGPKSTKIEKTITMEAIMRPVNPLGTILSATLRNISVLINRENAETINLSQCAAGTELMADLERPFLITYDTNGVLQNVKLGRKENNLSANFKLFGGSVVQVNVPLIHGLVPKVTERKELTLEGTCLVKEEIEKSNKAGLFLLNKNYNVAECSEVTNTDEKSDGLTCLSNTCNRVGEKDLTWTAENNMQIQLVNKIFLVPQKANIKQQLSYKPFKNQDTKLSVDLNINVELLSMEPTKDHMITHVDEVVTGQLKNPVSKSICDAKNEKSNNDDLRQLYSAIECEQTFAALYGDIIEKAIECSSRY